MYKYNDSMMNMISMKSNFNLKIAHYTYFIVHKISTTHTQTITILHTIQLMITILYTMIKTIICAYIKHGH